MSAYFPPSCPGLELIIVVGNIGLSKLSLDNSVYHKVAERQRTHLIILDEPYYTEPKSLDNDKQQSLLLIFFFEISVSESSVFALKRY
jgi:hypothetical protein